MSGDPRLTGALQALERAIADVCNPLARGLQPGVAPTEVRARVAERGIEPPDDLLTLFGWHDGYVSSSDTAPAEGWVGPALRIISLSEACDVHDLISTTLALKVELNEISSVAWFPVFDMSGWDVVVMNCGPEDPRRGEVMGLSPDMPVSAQRPMSLVEPVVRWTEYIRSGVWTWDPRDGWDSHLVDVSPETWRRQGCVP